MNQEMREVLPHMCNNIIHLCYYQQTRPPFQLSGRAFTCGSHPGLKHLLFCFPPSADINRNNS